MSALGFPYLDQSREEVEEDIFSAAAALNKKNKLQLFLMLCGFLPVESRPA
jgi:hypothetical protein